MDKNILKKFAIESRRDLMKKIAIKLKTFYLEEEFSKEQKNDLYVLSNENFTLNLTSEQYQKRELLIKRIKELSLQQVIDEASFTWFNRIMAIRYMEINDLLPLTKENASLGIRVLSSKDNKADPEILKFTNLTNHDLDINFKKEKYYKLKEEERFEYIILLICKKIGKVIPQVFDGTTDYIDILIPDNLLNETGFVNKVVTEIPENNFHNVEIIGWLYQYYMSEKKEEVFSEFKNNKKVSKKTLPAATQLFTPNWIVKYLVENSLGRFWLEHSADKTIKTNWKYYIDSECETKDSISPMQITFIDPCSGSGHILIYAFEVLYQIYLSAGYNKTDIPELILKNNLYGLDIDDRAGQLSILTVLLKAREYDKNIFNKDISSNLNILSIQESTNIEDFAIEYLPENTKMQAQYLKEIFHNAKEIGSLLHTENNDYSELMNAINKELTLESLNLKDHIMPLIKQANILAKKYDIVVTNPPYLNNNVMNDTMKKFLNTNYKNSKTDLCTAFMEVSFIKENGFLAMINQQSWMFLGSFAKLRESIINTKSIINMIHLGPRAFEEIGGEVVQVAAFVFQNNNKNKNGIYVKLDDYNEAALKEKKYLELISLNKYFVIDINCFKKIPGFPIAYWVNDVIYNIFNAKKLIEICDSKTGMTTGDNNRFLRFWYEINYGDINKKYFFYNKGGGYRKWYGNIENVINWENNGKLLKQFENSTIRNEQYYFKKCLTWNLISTTKISVRALDNYFVMGDAGPACYPDENNYYLLLGLLNSNVASLLLNILNPTINYSCGVMESFPVILSEKAKIEKLVKENIEISKADWNSFETSKDFKTHPLIQNKTNHKIKDSFNKWEEITINNFQTLKANEEEINKIFIAKYGLQNDLTPEIPDKDITIKNADQLRDIKSFISYAVGCMFGRYSLDEEELIYAGGDFNPAKYQTFKADSDNIIPITDEPCFGSDILSKFKKFVEIVYGKETVNENMDYIAETLGKKGTETSEETIRRYFNNDFYSDHLKTYQKKPIYWQFNSGKNNALKCLTYIHRYNEGLVGKLRLDYVIKIQSIYEKMLENITSRLSEDLDMSTKKELQKKQANLNAKMQEIMEYYENVSHLADKKISIDLDNGVTINYAKFTCLNSKTNKEESILGPIK